MILVLCFFKELLSRENKRHFFLKEMFLKEVLGAYRESSYETEAINQWQQKMSNEMYYPERAKID
jgi:hypothetical protein